MDTKTKEKMIAELEACGDVKVLRQLDLSAGEQPFPGCPDEPVLDLETMRRERPRTDASNDNSDTLVVAVVDVEATGLDPRKDAVIELAVRRFKCNAHGHIVRLDRIYQWCEDPGLSLDPKVAALTGLRDEDLRGQAIDERMSTSLLMSADVIVAHNAAYDRKCVERRLPRVVGRAWACSLREIDWSARGFSGGALGYLLAQHGFYHGAHRASGDIDAVVKLLQHRTWDRGTALLELLQTASKTTLAVAAVGADFAVKDDLKARGYRWDGSDKVWSREIPYDQREAETAWLEANVYAPHHRARMDGPRFREVTWCDRHA